MLYATPGANRFTCSVELEDALNLGATALLNIIKYMFVRGDTAETQPEPEPEPDHRTPIRIRRWGTGEQEEIRGIWVTTEELQQMEQLNLLTDAIVTGPYYDLASEPSVTRDALHEKPARATRMRQCQHG